MKYQVKITGTGTRLGSNKISLADIANKFGKKYSSIEKLKIDNLYRFSDGESLEYVAEVASQLAIQNASNPHIDGIFASVGGPTTEFLMPGLARTLADNMKIQNIPAYTLSMGCAGGLHALQMAHNQSVADAISGKVSNYLVVAGDQFSRVLNPKSWATAPLFSEGAASLIVSNNPSAKGVYIDKIASTTFPSSEDVPLNSMRLKNPNIEKSYFEMVGDKVYVFAVKHTYPEILKLMGLKEMGDNYFIPHQASGRIVDTIIRRNDLDAQQVYTNGRKIGNTSGASVFFGLEDTLKNNLHDGRDILLGAFGAELSISAAILKKK